MRCVQVLHEVPTYVVKQSLTTMMKSATYLPVLVGAKSWEKHRAGAAFMATACQHEHLEGNP